MTDTPGELPATPQHPPRKASSWRVVLMLVIGGPILAVGGCALFLSDFRLEGGGGNDNLSALGAIIFVAGCVTFLVGVVWALVRWLLRLSDKAQKNQPQ